MLSVSALEAAVEASKTGELLFSESMTVRARALVGKAAAAAADSDAHVGAHWDVEMGKERVLEVMGRMVEGGRGLREKLLLHGLE